MIGIILINPIPFHLRKNFKQKGGDLNDEGGVDC